MKLKYLHKWFGFEVISLCVIFIWNPSFPGYFYLKSFQKPFIIYPNIANFYSETRTPRAGNMFTDSIFDNVCKISKLCSSTWDWTNLDL